MSDTNWINGTVIDANWMNDVNDAVYSGIGAAGVAPTTPAQVRTNLDVPTNAGVGATGTWSINITGSVAANTITSSMLNTQVVNGATTVTIVPTDYVLIADTSDSGNVKKGLVSDILPSLGNPIASTSGTAITYTGIASTVKRITVMFSNVSTNGSSNYLIQIGPSGGFETTGYVSTGGVFVTAGPTVVASTAGFIINSGSGSNTLSGSVVLVLQDVSTNTWTVSGHFSSIGGGDALFIVAGSKSLAGVLDRIRVTTVSGSDTFDSGKINILYN